MPATEHTATEQGSPDVAASVQRVRVVRWRTPPGSLARFAEARRSFSKRTGFRGRTALHRRADCECRARPQPARRPARRCRPCRSRVAVYSSGLPSRPAPSIPTPAVFRSATHETAYSETPPAPAADPADAVESPMVMPSPVDGVRDEDAVTVPPDQGPTTAVEVETAESAPLATVVHPTIPSPISAEALKPHAPAPPVTPTPTRPATPCSRFTVRRLRHRRHRARCPARPRRMRRSPPPYNRTAMRPLTSARFRYPRLSVNSRPRMLAKHLTKHPSRAQRRRACSPPCLPRPRPRPCGRRRCRRCLSARTGSVFRLESPPAAAPAPPAAARPGGATESAESTPIAPSPSPDLRLPSPVASPRGAPTVVARATRAAETTPVPVLRSVAPSIGLRAPGRKTADALAGVESRVDAYQLARLARRDPRADRVRLAI